MNCCPACNVSRDEHPEQFFDEHELCADCEASVNAWLDGLPDSIPELLALNSSGTEFLAPNIELEHDEPCEY
jgi:hypothetical protein